MSFAAEPYAQCVDDLLTGLTGGVVRERFVFLRENEPFELRPPGPVVPTSVRLHGLAGSRYRVFVPGRDYDLVDGTRIVFRAEATGEPAADATWPDEGTVFHANYYYKAFGGPAPLLSDRNPGSVLRLLAESFAREYAVFSRQLEGVYLGAYLETATGRDLDQLVRLVGVERRRATFAGGAVVFTRHTPAPADINIPAGTKLSTSEPPYVELETTEARTLARGTLSVEVPIQATVAGAAGIAKAGLVTVIHQPILGIEGLTNPQATRFAASDETDAALRARARRALEGAGKGTVGALLQALSGLPSVREKDIRIAEDHLEHPGVVRLDLVAPDLGQDERTRAIALIEETRPAGIRVVHNIVGADTAALVDVLPPLADADPPAESPPVSTVPGDAEGGLFPVGIRAEIVPAAADLSARERFDLKTAAETAARAFVEDAGVGEVLVYHRLVAALMALDGVLDVDVTLCSTIAADKEGKGSPPGPIATRRSNLMPANPAQRPYLPEPAGLLVEVGGQPLAVDLSVRVTLKGAGLVGNHAANRQAAGLLIRAQLGEALRVWPVDRALSKDALDAALLDTDSYEPEVDHYKLDYVESGIRILKKDPTIELTGLERLWLRSLVVLDGGTAG